MHILKLPPLVDLNTYIAADKRNRYIGGKIKKEMTELVAMECISQKMPKLSQIKSFRMVWIHRDMRKDFDNVEFGVKFIKDGMVMAGVIANDGWKHFPPRTVHEHKIDKESPGVEVYFD